MSDEKKTASMIKLADGREISVTEYLAAQQTKTKVERPLILGRITSVKALDKGRYYITPCWSTPGGDDNICAFVSKNPGMPRNDIKVGLPVLFSVGKDFKNAGKFLALDVQPCTEDTEINYLIERPADYPTNISKSRQEYIEKDAEFEAKKESDNCDAKLEIDTSDLETKLLLSLGFSEEEIEAADELDNDQPATPVEVKHKTLNMSEGRMTTMADLEKQLGLKK